MSNIEPQNRLNLINLIYSVIEPLAIVFRI